MAQRIRVGKLRYVLGFLIAATVVILRRPDCIFHAQFYAEDGRLFYAQAHNLGWFRAIFIPYQGYFHLFPRLVSAVAMLFPLALGPLVQNALAVCVETLPVLLLISPVCEKWGSMRFRCLLALLYLAVPNCGQIIGSITESQWILGLVAFLIIMGDENRGLLWLLALCCLTGPFCIFLLPFAVWGKRHSILAIAAAGAAIQGVSIALTPRTHVPLGASIPGLLHILGAQVYAGALLGPCAISLRAAITTAVLVTLFLAFVGGKEIRGLQILALIIFMASLLSPTVVPTDGLGAWATMAAWAGKRYWFIPCLAVLWSIAFALRSKRLQAPAILLAVVMIAGILRDFSQPPRQDFRFSASVARYDTAARNARVVIPQPPDGWQTVLIKHQ